MKIDKNFVLREIAGEYIIIPTGRTALEFNGLITVNEVGMELWKMLQEDENAAREDIQEFLDRLVKGGILTEDEKSEK